MECSVKLEKQAKLKQFERILTQPVQIKPRRYMKHQAVPLSPIWSATSFATKHGQQYDLSLLWINLSIVPVVYKILLVYANLERIITIWCHLLIRNIILIAILSTGANVCTTVKKTRSKFPVRVDLTTRHWFGCNWHCSLVSFQSLIFDIRNLTFILFISTWRIWFIRVLWPAKLRYLATRLALIHYPYRKCKIGSWNGNTIIINSSFLKGYNNWFNLVI